MPTILVGDKPGTIMTTVLDRPHSVDEEIQQHSEGPIARRIEEQTAKLPWDTFLWAALGAMGVSAALQVCGRRHDGLFVGQWAAPILVLGLYNKIVKVAGSDRTEQTPHGHYRD